MGNVAFKLFGIEIAWYGIIITAAVIMAIAIAVSVAKHRGVRKDDIYDMALLTLPLGIIGARLYYVVFDAFWGGAGNLDYYKNFWNIINLRNGGLAIYGAVIGGFIAVLLFCRFRKINRLAMLDIAALVVILAQGIGRWGNFINQEAFGSAVTNPAWQWFPFAVHITRPGVAQGWYMATFFYESLWAVLTFVVLLAWMKGWGFFGKINTRWAQKRGIDAQYPRRAMPAGNLLWGYLALYGLERAIVEYFRTDSLMIGPLKVSMILSMAMVVVGIVMLFVNNRTGQMAPQEYIEPQKNDEPVEDPAVEETAEPQDEQEMQDEQEAQADDAEQADA